MRGTARRLTVIVMAICAGTLAVAAASASASAKSATADPPAISIGADGKTAPVFSYADAIRERVSIPVRRRRPGRRRHHRPVAIDIIRPAEPDRA